jgi:hypothetical protein
MALSVTKPISSLAAALAQADSRSKSQDAGHPAPSQSLPTPRQRGGLPTPPNSLSPTLPPHKGRAFSAVESDLELHDAEDEPQQLSKAALSGIQDAEQITPNLLAKHYLPDILLKNGPLAIRFVLAELTQNVPGFGRIPPAKARRLCVAALEARSGGGLEGETVFEKIGWGRWSARHRDDPPHAEASSSSGDHSSPPPNLSSAPYGTRTATGTKIKSNSRYIHSPLLSPNEDMDVVPEEEADKMSLDGEELSKPVRKYITVIEPPEDDEMTDEEDWASIGPEALRAGSYEPSNASHRGSRRGSHVSSLGRPILKSGSISSPYLRPQARKPSLPVPTIDFARSMSYSGGIIPFQRVYSSSLSSSLRKQGVQEPAPRQRDCGSPEEREAVEALLRLGSM